MTTKTKKAAKAPAKRKTAKKSKAIQPNKRRKSTPAKATEPTNVSLILDESSSMDSIRQSTISSINEYVNGLKAKAIPVKFTMVKFNSTRTQIVHAATPLDQVAALTSDDYTPNGLTPLYDAVGRAIASLKSTSKGTVLVAIVTDGEENTSKEYTREKVAEMIREQEKAGWTFVYLGANHDAWAAAGSIGIRAQNTLHYAKDNVKGAMSGLTDATVRYVASPVAARGLGAFFNEADKKKIEKTNETPTL